MRLEVQNILFVMFPGVQQHALPQRGQTEQGPTVRLQVAAMFALADSFFSSPGTVIFASWQTQAVFTLTGKFSIQVLPLLNGGTSPLFELFFPSKC